MILCCPWLFIVCLGSTNLSGCWEGGKKEEIERTPMERKRDNIPRGSKGGGDFITDSILGVLKGK